MNFSTSSSGVSFTVAPDVTVTSSGGTDRLVSIERVQIFGSEHADSFTGGDYDDYVWAGAGNDVLNGGGGDDILIGGEGDDTIDGGEGTDLTAFYFHTSDAGVTFTFSGDGTYSSGEGTDTLVSVEEVLIYGSRYADIISGGSGDDSLYG